MTDPKVVVTVRLDPADVAALDKLVEDGAYRSRSAAVAAAVADKCRPWRHGARLGQGETLQARAARFVEACTPDWGAMTADAVERAVGEVVRENRSALRALAEGVTHSEDGQSSLEIRRLREAPDE